MTLLSLLAIYRLAVISNKNENIVHIPPLANPVAVPYSQVMWRGRQIA